MDTAAPRPARDVFNEVTVSLMNKVSKDGLVEGTHTQPWQVAFFII